MPKCLLELFNRESHFSPRLISINNVLVIAPLHSRIKSRYVRINGLQTARGATVPPPQCRTSTALALGSPAPLHRPGKAALLPRSVLPEAHWPKNSKTPGKLHVGATALVFMRDMQLEHTCPMASSKRSQATDLPPLSSASSHPTGVRPSPRANALWRCNLEQPIHKSPKPQP